LCFITRLPPLLDGSYRARGSASTHARPPAGFVLPNKIVSSTRIRYKGCVMRACYSLLQHTPTMKRNARKQNRYALTHATTERPNSFSRCRPVVGARAAPVFSFVSDYHNGYASPKRSTVHATDLHAHHKRSKREAVACVSDYQAAVLACLK